MHSLSIDWSDSDSSIDSMPEESGNESSGNEEGWPKQTGFQVRVTMKVEGKRRTYYTCHVGCLWGGKVSFPSLWYLERFIFLQEWRSV